MAILEMLIVGFLFGGCLMATYFFLIYPNLNAQKPWCYRYMDLTGFHVVEYYKTLEDALIVAVADEKADSNDRRPVSVSSQKITFTVDKEAIQEIGRCQEE